MNRNLIKQVEYENWANILILSALPKVTDDERVLFLFSHILSVHAMWLNRLKGEPLTCTLFESRTPDVCAKLIEENTEGWTAYFNTADATELERMLHYVNPHDGSRRKMVVEDIIIQIFGHSCYHRGQIVARMKGKVEPLPNTTYIAFASQPD